MTTDSANPQAQPAAPPAPTRRRVFPPALPAISLLAVMVGSGLLICWLAASGFSTISRDADAASAGRFAQLIAALVPAGNDRLTSQLEAMGASAGLRRVVVKDAAGTILVDWPSAGHGQADVSLSEPTVAARKTLHGGAGEVEVWIASAASSAPRRRFFGWAMSALAATIIAGLVVLYRVRNEFRPLQAIRDNVESFAAGIERQFTALSLSDALGQTARAWNHVVEHVAQMQAQIPRSGGDAFANDTMQRYESRALRRILDQVPLGLVRYGTNQVVDYHNAAAARILHVGESQEPRPLPDFLASVSDAAAIVQQLTVSGRSLERRCTINDAELALRFNVIAPGDAAGQTLLVIEDISHVHEAERARDNFLYHVTHELRTPLTNIQAYVETLSKPDFDDEATRRECYNVIMSETRRLSRLVEDILSISQLEVGTALVEMDEVDLARLVRQMVQDNLGGADDKHIELSLKLPPKVPKVRGDKQRLSVLINNLVGNGIKYTAEGGQVNVLLAVDEARIRISVSDTGCGIEEKDQPYVFEKFYRGAATNSGIPGTGLGLAIAREVARLHGGDIHLESTPGKGSTFTVDLPLLRPDGVLT